MSDLPDCRYLRTPPRETFAGVSIGRVWAKELRAYMVEQGYESEAELMREARELVAEHLAGRVTQHSGTPAQRKLLALHVLIMEREVYNLT